MESRNATPYSQMRSTAARPGLTLVEVMMAMTIFVVLAGGIIAGVFTVRADAENNLYEMSSMNVALSFLEQTKGLPFDQLEGIMEDGSEIRYLTGFIEFKDMELGEEEELEVPIISDVDGNVKKALDVTVEINVTEADDFNGYWLTVDYRWEHPTNNKLFEGQVRSFKSNIANY